MTLGAAPRRAGRGKRARLAVLLCVLCASTLFADTVILTNGRRLVGRVTEDGATVVVETEYGTIRLPRAQVQGILKQRTVLDEYAERVQEVNARLEAGKLEAKALARAWCEVAEWSAQMDFRRGREESLRRALAADPESEAAHLALGHVRVGHKWLTPEQRLEALGLVRYRNRWVTPEARADAERAAEESRRRELERAAAEAEQRRKQAEAERLKAERGPLDLQSRFQQGPRSRLFYIPGYPYPYYYLRAPLAQDLAPPDPNALSPDDDRGRPGSTVSP
jgi:hypothetical protein